MCFNFCGLACTGGGGEGAFARKLINKHCPGDERANGIKCDRGGEVGGLLCPIHLSLFRGPLLALMIRLKQRRARLSDYFRTFLSLREIMRSVVRFEALPPLRHRNKKIWGELKR